MDFRETLLSHKSDLEGIPRGYKRYGHVMILRSGHPLDPAIGRTAIALYDWCHTVYQQINTRGEYRVPELVLLAGEDNPQVIHRENGVSYNIDLRRITFSGGNRRLREELVGMVHDGEFLVDMFAAVGNLSMQPLVHHDIRSILIEKNPYTYDFLLSTLKLNNLNPEIAINSDCRDLDITDCADRVFMGYHDIDSSHLQAAIIMAKPQSTLHLHPILARESLESQIAHQVNLVKSLDVLVEEYSYHKVKSYAPGLSHYHLIISIKK